jgi:hypothetical protein
VFPVRDNQFSGCKSVVVEAVIPTIRTASRALASLKHLGMCPAFDAAQYQPFDETRIPTVPMMDINNTNQ